MKNRDYQINRREFAALGLALAARPTSLFASSTSLGDALRGSMTRRKIPCVAAMVATADKVIYSGAFGKRDSASGVDVKPDSIFYIASMTKAITTTAALQLVEQGKLDLHEPVSKHLPELAHLNVLTGFDAAGKPVLRPATKPVTLHHLLTHTSGFAYDTWNDKMFRYVESGFAKTAGTGNAAVTPIVFEPGTRWQYGTSLDWTGRLVEAVSGLTLEQYFRRNILQPLGMKDTGFILPAARFDRVASTYRRQPDGSLKQDVRKMPDPPRVFNGGGGIYSTTQDYVLFMQMILHQGKGTNNARILETKSVAMMTANQIGDISAGKLKSFRPTVSSDVDFHPGMVDGYTYGFLINKTAYPGGRSAGSLAWAGIQNTFFWIDPQRSMCAVVMMQYYPFGDSQAVGLLSDFEKAVYAA